jgi:hypothetical protein
MSSSKSMKNSVVLAALQIAIGTPAIPTSAADAMLVGNITAKPVAAVARHDPPILRQ